MTTATTKRTLKTEKKHRITIEHINGETDTFGVPHRVAGWVADALAQSDTVWGASISIEINGSVYKLESRRHINPMWRLQNAPPGSPTDHTRHSAFAEHAAATRR